MAKINIDGKEYEFDDLSNEQKGQILSLQFVETELQRLEAQIAVFKTAQMAYINELKSLLPTTAN
ncbi:hypothetical protein F6R98_01070 [Candidatus Methylospira mobilis]|uniref:Uncharacterized protein n=1 Tax=Candidatus Methylospira mobilis TaxID=1808979 RepID=A0A5Q0BGT4_9GAMM|nr:DUF6447 family protein [Candidatus Methylospira mobilis]QFY41387.1 hypothetical protein F6R98_01070 [Candidatus Methylospira mobilis]